MDRQQAERITTEYIKDIYAFTLRRCNSIQDAEDLSQDITIKIFNSLIEKEDINDVNKYIWTIAHNSLKNYYRKKDNSFIGISFEQIDNYVIDSKDMSTDIIKRESIERLQKGIAYLSKTQRKIIIAYYFESKSQKDIADELGLPIGIVKWHLFEAKKELKKGFNIMRKTETLKFNPIAFSVCGTNGIIGENGLNSDVLRSSLIQNILYCVYREAKTINEIADELRVSPVFIESEIEFLEKYSYVTEKQSKYLCNILIDEPNEEIIKLKNEMYEKVAQIFANELFDELIKFDLLNDKDIIGGYIDVPNLNEKGSSNLNQILWAIIPYIISFSGMKQMKNSISFEQSATYRADGGHNICYATVLDNSISKAKYYDEIRNSYGPCLNENYEYQLWQLDTEWSNSRINAAYHYNVKDTIQLIQRFIEGEELSKIDYAELIEKGIIKTTGTLEGLYKGVMSCVLLNSETIRNKLIEIGDKIKEAHSSEFDALKKPYVEAVLNETPQQLQTMQKYGLQCAFYGDRWFIIHCLKQLVNNGKLSIPTEEQKVSLHTLIIKK